MGLAVPQAVGSASLIQNSSGHAVEGEQEGGVEMASAKASGDIFVSVWGCQNSEPGLFSLEGRKPLTAAQCLMMSFITSLPREWVWRERHLSPSSQMRR